MNILGINTDSKKAIDVTEISLNSEEQDLLSSGDISAVDFDCSMIVNVEMAKNLVLELQKFIENNQ